MTEFDIKNITNTEYMVKDLVQGDTDVLDREDFNDKDKEEIKTAFSLIINNPKISEREKMFFLANSWKIFYRTKPPTIDEFLTPAWIGPTADSLFPQVRKTLTEFMAPTSQYRHLILASSIGSGKSTASSILALYILTCVNLLINPKKYFNLAQSASIVGVLISFSMKKAKQLLAQPFYQILQSSPKFVRVKQQERLESKQREIGHSKIAWTSASRMEGILETAADTHILLASDPANLLGLNLLFSIMSELSFFIDRGVSPDEIWRVYNDSKGRVASRFGLGSTNRFFGITVMDSSPNDIELPIDKYVFSGQAEKDPLNYVLKGPHWEFHPLKYPVWQKTNETFLLFRGSASRIPKLINEEERSDYHPEDIIEVPIDAKQKFIDDIRKSTKDYAAWPAGGTNKLFEDPQQVESIFNENLINILTFIYAPSDKEPEGLIWNQVKDIFFVQIENRYEFYRNPNAPRYLAFDLSETGDKTGVSMVHMENFKGENMVVVDFTIAISPGKGRINLDAVYEFVVDLIRHGNINLVSITGDSYGPSKSMIQRFKRFDLNSEVLSVDIDTAPYYTLASYAKNGRLRVGKNLVLKGNLNSLIETKTEKGKRKIDHTMGQVSNDPTETDWLLSTLGRNEKDVSDSLCAAAFKCIVSQTTAPSFVWDREKTLTKQDIKENMKLAIYKNFGLKTSVS